MKRSHLYLLLIILLTGLVFGTSAFEASASSIQTSCSAGGTQAPMMLTFTNYLSEAVNIYWLDSDCVEQYYATLNPNASYYQPTYDGHEWEVVTVSDKQVGIIIADPSATHIDIQPSTAGSNSIITRTGMGCSMGGTQTAVTVTITNNRTEPVNVFWLDSGCIAIQYMTLEPNTSYEQATYDGHEWQVFTTEGAFVGAFVASTNGLGIEVYDPLPGDAETPIVPDQTCSSGGTQAATTVTFTNTLMEPVHLFWLDYNCSVRYYTTLVSADSYEQPTYDGHEWVIYTTQGDYVGNFVASSSTPEIDIQ